MTKVRVSILVCCLRMPYALTEVTIFSLSSSQIMLTRIFQVEQVDIVLSQFSE